MSINLLTLQGISFQNPNMWEFYIVDPKAPQILKFLIMDVVLPFERLETETRNTGTKHYTKFSSIGDFSFNFRETTKFEVYDYFSAWKEEIYDSKERVFKTGGFKTKTAILAFQESKLPIMSTYNKVFQFNKLRIKGIEDKSLDYNSNEGLTLSVSFTADEVIEANTAILGVSNILENILGNVNYQQLVGSALGAVGSLTSTLPNASGFIKSFI